jgi:hypothetical protein
MATIFPVPTADEFVSKLNDFSRHITDQDSLMKVAFSFELDEKLLKAVSNKLLTKHKSVANMLQNVQVDHSVYYRQVATVNLNMS